MSFVSPDPHPRQDTSAIAKEGEFCMNHNEWTGVCVSQYIEVGEGACSGHTQGQGQRMEYR